MLELYEYVENELTMAIHFSVLRFWVAGTCSFRFGGNYDICPTIILLDGDWLLADGVFVHLF